MLQYDKDETEALFEFFGRRYKKIKKRLIKKWNNYIQKKILRPCDHHWVLIYKGNWKNWFRCPKCKSYLSPKQDD